MVNEYDEEIPEEEGKFTFEINKGHPDISNLSKILPDSVNNIKLEIFGSVLDVREQLKAVENMIAAGFGQYSGTVVIYNKASDKTSQKRYKCFVRDDEKSYGSFEIIQEDKNDANIIDKSTKSWWEKVKGFFSEVAPVVKTCCEIISCVIGVTRDIKTISNFSSFLRIPFLHLLIILCLF